MSLTLDLPPELETELAAEAARLRLPIAEYVLRVLAVGRLPNPMPRTGAEVVAYWEREGLLGTRPDITDPSGHSRALREKAEMRERLSEPQKRELDRRIAELEANPQNVRTWEEIKAHVREPKDGSR